MSSGDCPCCGRYPWGPYEPYCSNECRISEDARERGYNTGLAKGLTEGARISQKQFAEWLRTTVSGTFVGYHGETKEVAKEMMQLIERIATAASKGEFRK